LTRFDVHQAQQSLEFTSEQVMKTRVKSLSLQMKLIASTIAALTSTSAIAGELVDVQVLGRGGFRSSFIPSFYAQGEQYIEARQGQEFRVRLRNNSSQRVLAVLSVDGVNAITGQTASFDQAGYVLEAYQSMDVDGWRKSNRQTAAFYFTHFSDAYATRTNRPSDLGVIGVAVFQERSYYSYDSEQPYYHDEYDYRYRGKNVPPPQTTRPAPSAAPSARSAESAPELARQEDKSFGAGAPLGTGHGRREYSRSVNVAFDREDSVSEVTNIRYDSRQNLIAMGVIPSRGYYSHGPRSFPREHSSQGFTPDPWN
jgi:hypothetical protein